MPVLIPELSLMFGANLLPFNVT